MTTHMYLGFMINQIRGSTLFRARFQRSQCVELSTSSRKLLTPIIMAIHPDRFQNDSKNVQSSNLLCVQTINEVWDIIEGYEESISRSTSLKSNYVDVTQCLKDAYTLLCYIKKEQDNETVNLQEPPDNSLEKVDITLKIPVEFRVKGNNMPKNNIIRALSDIYRQMGVVSTVLGIDNKWKDLIKSDLRSRITRNSEGTTDEKYDTAEFHQKLFERALIYNKYGRIDDIISYSGRKGKESRKSKLMREQLAQDAVLYITSGNVKLRNVTMLEDILIVTKFQDFLVEYGPYLNFDIFAWKNILVVIHGDKVLKRSHSFLTENGSIVKSKYHAKKWIRYSFEKIDGKSLIEIPKDFKAQDLSEFIADHITLPKEFYEL